MPTILCPAASQRNIESLTAQMVANQFSANLRFGLNSDQMKEIIRRNRTPKYAGCCASHDFTDANMVMLAAFEELLGYEPDVTCDDEDESKNRVQRLWNEAWEIARAAEFAV